MAGAGSWAHTTWTTSRKQGEQNGDNTSLQALGVFPRLYFISRKTTPPKPIQTAPLPGNQVFKGWRLVVMFTTHTTTIFLLVVLPWWKTLKALFLYGMLPTVTSFPLWTCGLWIRLQLQQWFMVHVLFCRKFRSIIYASDHFKGIRSYPRIIFLLLPACFLLKIIHHLQINK